ncbi:MAG: hypothetical protein ACXVIM_07655 [Acidimicrobiia bacterium]
MSEFDDVLDTRSVAEVLRVNLENAEAQLRLEQRRARRAQQRVHDLGRAVESWHALIAEYEQATSSSAADRRN